MSESTNRDAGEATTDVLQAEQVDTFQPLVWCPSLSPHTTCLKRNFLLIIHLIILGVWAKNPPRHWNTGLHRWNNGEDNQLVLDPWLLSASLQRQTQRDWRQRRNQTALMDVRTASKWPVTVIQEARLELAMGSPELKTDNSRSDSMRSELLALAAVVNVTQASSLQCTAYVSWLAYVFVSYRDKKCPVL